MTGDSPTTLAVTVVDIAKRADDAVTNATAVAATVLERIGSVAGHPSERTCVAHRPAEPGGCVCSNIVNGHPAVPPQRAVTWATEVKDLVRAASGGLLFGAPLLFTVEVLWTAEHTGPERMAFVLLLSFVPLVALNRTEGFRSTRDVRFRDALMDAVEGVALAVVLVIAVLVLLGEIDSDTPLQVALGKMAYEVMPFCIGIGVARHILRGGGSEGDADDGESGAGTPEGGDSGEEDAPADALAAGSTPLNATLTDLGASMIGSVFIALSIAPTDEVPLLAASRSPLWLVAIMAASLVIAYAIVFVAGFSGQSDRHAQAGLLQSPVAETVTSYVVALIAAYLMLATFQRVDGPWQLTLSHVIILGLPAAIGGAAGRLAV